MDNLNSIQTPLNKCLLYSILCGLSSLVLTTVAWRYVQHAPFALTALSCAFLSWRCGLGYGCSVGLINAFLIDSFLIPEGYAMGPAFLTGILYTLGCALLAAYMRQHDMKGAQKSAGLQQDVALRNAFISTAAHELRNPIATLKMRVEILKRRPELVTEQLPLFETQFNRLMSVVNNLLDASRLVDGKIVVKHEPVPLCELLVRTANRLGAENFVLHLPNHEIEGLWDPFMLENIFGNLLHNAMKYGDPARPSEIFLVKTRNEAKVAIKDYGQGIADSDLAHIFEKYRRVGGNQKEGLGLGLWIVRETVKALGGQVNAKSAIGVGTEFEISLPLEEKGFPT